MNDMSGSPIVSPPIQFFGLSAERVQHAIVSAGLPSWRSRQLRDWVYRKLVTTPAEMSTFAKDQQELLARLFQFTSAAIDRSQASEDGTMKLLLRWPDGQLAETVMIPDLPRRTACISSQVGCPVGCRFCASGIGGSKGNLTAAQIVEQVFQLNLAMGSANEAVTNVVFMGMGEPLANYANVINAIHVLHDPGCMDLGARRITISTVGVPQRMLDLADEGLPINLAISLHAPSEDLRRQLIPWAHHFALEDILDAARGYFQKTGREITLEYILLAGVNDRPEHARELARLSKTIRCNVNLIRYNEVSGIEFRRPATEDVQDFQEILREAGVNAHVRRSRGRDIEAACGQLRRKAQQAKEDSN